MNDGEKRAERYCLHQSFVAVKLLLIVVLRFAKKFVELCKMQHVPFWYRKHKADKKCYAKK